MNSALSPTVDGMRVDDPRTVLIAESTASRINWGAILGGAIIAIALGTMINVLGLALGASSVDATARATPSATTFTLAAGIWMALAGALGLFIGGVICARLSGGFHRSDAVLHGIGVWAVAFLVTVVIVGGSVSGATMAALRGVSSAATGVAGIAGTAVAGAGASAAAQVNPEKLVEQLQRRISAPADVTTMSAEDRAMETSELLLGRLSKGSWTAEERGRLEQLVAATTGLPPADVSTRLTQMERDVTAQARAAEESARQAADVAAKGTSLAAFWAFAVMMLGLAAATLGAFMGSHGLNERRDLSVRV